MNVQNVDDSDNYQNEFQDSRTQNRFQTSGLDNFNRGDRSDQSFGFQKQNQNFNSSNYSNQGFMTQNLGRPETGSRKPIDKFSKTLGKMMYKKQGKNQNASYVEYDDDEGQTQQFGKIKREIDKETGKSQKTNLFRDMCFQFQLAGANYQKVTNNIDRDLKDDKLDQRTLVDQIFTNLKNQNDQSLFDLLNLCLQDFKDKNKRFIKLSKWLDRLHHEMDKFFMMERLFLLISRRIIKSNCTFFQLLFKQRAIIRQKAKYDELTAQKYDDLLKNNKIAANEFLKILENLGIIRVNNKEDFDKFIDEYGIIDEDVQKQLGLDNQISKEQDKTDTNQNKDDIKEDIQEQNENDKFKQIEDLKKKTDSTYIRIDELEADFEHFQSKIFPKIEEQVLNLIFNFCINAKISPRKLFFSKETDKKQEDQNQSNDENEENEQKQEKIEQNNDNNEDENKKDELNYKSNIDDLDLYYIADLIKIYENQENSYSSDYSKIFQLFALKVSNTLNEKKIQFAYIYSKLQKIVQQNNKFIQKEIIDI